MAINTMLLLGFLSVNMSAGRNTIPVDSALVTLIDRVEVASREGGILAEVAVREGDLVERGALLAQLDDAEVRILRNRAEFDLQIAWQRAESDVHVRTARKTSEVAEADLKRALEANENYEHSVSATELDLLRLATDRARLEIEQAQLEQKMAQLTAQLKQNEKDLADLKIEHHKIRATMDGMVVQVSRKPGEWVQPGDVVMRLLRLSRLRAEFFLDATAIRPELTGANVTLTVDLPDKLQSQFSGRIVFVSPEINPVNGQTRVWAEIDNPQRLLRPGLRGSLLIELPAASKRKTQPTD